MVAFVNLVLNKIMMMMMMTCAEQHTKKLCSECIRSLVKTEFETKPVYFKRL